MRLGLSVLTLITGAVLALVSYFVLAAPIGTPIDESFSNPRVPYAATLFVIGVSLTMVSVVVYEVLSDKAEPEA